MLIASVSLLMNVAIYVAILIAIIITCEYLLIGIAWTKVQLTNLVIQIRAKIRELKGVLDSIQNNLSNAVNKLSNLNLNPLAGVC
jgi:hypothetical protein